MESEQRLVACQFCQKLVPFPPTFNDTLQCACGAKYHYEFGADLYIEVDCAEEEGREWNDIFVGAAVWDDEEEFEEVEEAGEAGEEAEEESGSWFDFLFSINYDVKEEDLLPHEDKIYLFFTK